MEKNNYIELQDFENVTKYIDKKKYNITKMLELKNNKLVVTKWEIFNKKNNSDNVVLLASYKGDDIQSIINLIEKNKLKTITNIDKMDSKISNKLIELGISLNGNSIKYWKYILKRLYEDKKLRLEKISYLYAITAQHFHTTTDAAERCLRYGKDKMKANIMKEYNLPDSSRVSNGTILNFFIENIF